jgi:hypothetical protein
MSPSRAATARLLPLWIERAISALVLFHLFALVILILSAPSGPWPSPMGASQTLGPPFATQIAEFTTRKYLKPIGLTHNYHFLDNRPDSPDVVLHLRLKDDDGNTTQEVQIPSGNENPWLRYRHTMLAQGLAGDEPVEAPRGEVIPAPGQQMRKIPIWESTGPTTLKLRAVPQHLIPKDQPVSRPSTWSLVLAHSYQRYLARHYGASSVELVRHSRQAIMPAILLLPETPRGTFDTLISTYEEYSRDN